MTIVSSYTFYSVVPRRALGPRPRLDFVGGTLQQREDLPRALHGVKPGRFLSLVQLDSLGHGLAEDRQ